MKRDRNVFLYGLCTVFCIHLLLTSWAYGGRYGEIRMTDGTVYRGEIVVRGNLRLVTWAEDELGLESKEEMIEKGYASEAEEVYQREGYPTRYTFSGDFTGRERLFNIESVDSIQIEPRPDLFSRILPAERMMQRWDWKYPDPKDDPVPDRPPSEAPKVYLGEPYPVRELQAVVTFTSGEVLQGALSRCAIYIYPEDSFTAERFIVRSQERGEEGEDFDDIVHVEEVRFIEEGAQFDAKHTIQFKASVPDGLESVWALTRETLAPLSPEPVSGSNDTVEVGGAYGESFSVAIKKNGVYYIGWNEQATEQMYEVAAKHVKELRDFYNERELLGVYDIEGSHDVLTLLRLRRTDAHILIDSDEHHDFEGTGNKEPYRISVLRWRFNADDNSMALVRRGSFFRKHIHESKPTPRGVPTEALWSGIEGTKSHIVIDEEVDSE